MTITLELPGELETNLLRNANRKGMPVEEYVLQTLQEQPAKDYGLQSRLSPEEWIAAFHQWIDDQPKNMPILSDEDISRESIYGDTH